MNIRTLAPEETYALRHLVLWPHKATAADCTIDIDHRADAMHWGVCMADAVVAIGSFFETPSTKLNAKHVYRLRAMAVHPDYRGQQLGQQLIHAAIENLRARNIELLWCDARLRAVPFYARMGFQSLPEIYEINPIGPHQFMWLNL